MVLSITIENINKLQEKLTALAAPFLGESFNDNPEMVNTMGPLFEELIELSAEFEFQGLVDYFNYLYANWTELDSYTDDFFVSVQNGVISSLVFFEPESDSLLADQLKVVLLECSWKMPLPEEALLELASGVEKDHKKMVVLITEVNEVKEKSTVEKATKKVAKKKTKKKSAKKTEKISVSALFENFSRQGELDNSVDLTEVKEKDFTSDQAEILQIFIDELNEICNELETEVVSEELLLEGLNQNLDIIGNLQDATEIIHYSALSDLLKIIADAVAAVNDSENMTDARNIIVWPWVLRNLFIKGINASTIGMVDCLIQYIAPNIAAPERHQICKQLGQFDFEIDGPSVPQRDTVAELSALDLSMPEDANPALLKSFLDELPDHMSEYTRSIESFLEHRFFSDLDIARRIAHTIKGSGSTIGIVGIANFTHHLEDILDTLAKKNTFPNEILSEVLMESADSLEMMSEVLLEGSEFPDEIVGVYQRILDCANALDVGGMAAVQRVENSEALILDGNQSAIKDPKPQENSDKASVINKEKASKADSSVRVSQSDIDDLIRVVGENMISSGRILEHAKTTKQSLQLLRKQHIQLNSLVSDLEQLVFVRGVSSDRSKTVGDFDPLELEQYNELHTATQRLLEAALDSSAILDNSIQEALNLESVVVDQVQLQRENQDQVLKMRMLPVSMVSSRFARAVRQTCRLTGKKAKLHLEGENTYVDSNILQQLIEPIMHILRNAIDHGIETPEERLLVGKAETGNITLRFERVADQISVNCSDDGRGLDYEKIIQKAREKNLIPESQEQLSQEEMTRFILIPGFSSKDEATQVSGRGIGMDVVNQKIHEIKGSLKISSQQGSGTSIAISLPVSLMSTHALLIGMGNNQIAISNHGIEDVVYLDEHALRIIKEQKLLSWNNEMLNAHALFDLLNIARPKDQEDRIAIIVGLSDGSYKAVMVPFIKDSRDLVLKPLSHLLPRIDGLIGASILGDGRVAPVVDLTELSLHTVADNFISNQSSEVVEAQYARQLPCVLVVDDSISARRSMASFVTDMGYSVVEGHDGIDAQERLDENNIVLVITDLEMPRMNGVELTRYMRARDEYKDIPVIMVTSRSTQKHRDLASKAGVQEYVTKPFSEDVLAEKLNKMMR